MFRTLSQRALLSHLFVAAIALHILHSGVSAADAPVPAKSVLKITPGQVIIPFDKMRRIWGELVSLDLATRTGKFRQESTDEVMTFTVMPYAELLHHATNGDLQDFRIGERAIFRMHENEKGEWVWLTYIQDQMNMMNGHREYFYVDRIDAAKGQLVCTQANFDKSYVREKGILIETAGDTRYWVKGEPARFADIKVGDKLRAKTHGIGKGKVQMCWDVFLDDESLVKFQTEQKAVHEQRIKQEGMPGYVDAVAGTGVDLTLFNEGGEQFKLLKVGSEIRVAPAGRDRHASGERAHGTVTSLRTTGRQCKIAVGFAEPQSGFQVTGLARLWAVEK